MQALFLILTLLVQKWRCNDAPRVSLDWRDQSEYRVLAILLPREADQSPSKHDLLSDAHRNCPPFLLKNRGTIRAPKDNRFAAL